jgi:hypothetical protein
MIDRLDDAIFQTIDPGWRVHVIDMVDYPGL